MKHCPSCGTEVDESNSYCHECGEDLTEVFAGGSEPAETATEEEGEGSGDDRDVPWKTYGDVSNTKEGGEKDDSMSGTMKAGFAVAILIIIVGLALVGGEGGSNVESPDADGTQNPGSTDGTSSDGGAASGESGDDLLTHEVGETFTVGSGERTIEYTVTEAVTGDYVGQSQFGEEADGVFVFVTLEIRNTANEPFSVTTNHLNLVDEEGRKFSSDDMAQVHLDQDPRYEDSITFEDLQPGLSIERTIAFDVSGGQGYILEVQDTDFFRTAEPHYVPLGQVE